MVCYISFFISMMFIIGMIYFNIQSYSNDTVQQYKNQLPDDLKILYEKITQERMMISIQGYVIGFALSLFIIIYNYNFNKVKLSPFSMICIVLAASFVTNYFYYILSPKTDWMLNNITDPDQVKAWLIMYNSMKTYYHTGLLFGLIAVIALAMAFRC
jgi:hypothetical protein